MPDKSQNININYKFNTAEIEKAQAALNKANAASNKLQESAGKTGASFDKQVVPSIQRMRTELGRLRTSIETEYKPQNRAKLVQEYNTIKKSLDEAVKSTYGLGKASVESSKGVQSLVLGFRDLSRFAGLAVFATMTKEVVDLSLSMATLQGQVEGVERGFNRAFINPVETLSQVREATKGTITDFDLMKRTLQATNLGVSVEHLGTLFEFAAARAQQTGESVDYLVDSIVRGIGRKSPLVLDNLGISVTALKEKFDGASIASKTVGEATEGVAEIAREQLEKMGGYAVTAETKVRQLAVAWENVRIAFAKKVETSGLAEFLKLQAETLEKLIKGNEQLAKEEAKGVAAKRMAAIMDQEIFKDRSKNQQQQLAILMEEIMATKQSIRLKGQEIEQFEKLQKTVEVAGVTSIQGSLEEFQAREKAIEGIKRQKEIYEALLPTLVNSLRLIQGQMETAKSHIETLDEMRERLKGLEDQFGAIAKTDTPAFQAKAKEIKDLRHEIEKIEALLKDPKELKVKVNVIEDDTWLRIMKFFDEGGTLKGKTLNPSTGEIVDLEARNASETIDVERMFEDVGNELDTVEDGMTKTIGEISDNVSGEFWARLRLGFKRQGAGANQAQEDLQNALIDLEVGGIDILADQLSSLADVEQASFDRRIRSTKQFYETQMTIAGDNEKAKDILRLREDKKIEELRKKQFIAEQKAARQQALINGAAAIVKTFAVYGFTPAAIVAVALLAAQTASQIAIINRQQPRFKEGVIDLKGPGTGTSDSIPAWLSRGESVMTAWETKNAGGILKDIRAKKLDDKVLRNLREGRAPVQAGFNDERIIKAIKDNRPPDIVEQSGIVFKSTNYNDEYRKKVRAKSVRI